mmetsp:Transcript_33606/g.81255  ORF Transcript_33606/g.81255 Transcript_33606/m.81255 type:complete len:204 (+) Transcript_33606:313-924(+)
MGERDALDHRLQEQVQMSVPQRMSAAHQAVRVRPANAPRNAIHRQQRPRGGQRHGLGSERNVRRSCGWQSDILRGRWEGGQGLSGDGCRKVHGGHHRGEGSNTAKRDDVPIRGVPTSGTPQRHRKASHRASHAVPARRHDAPALRRRGAMGRDDAVAGVQAMLRARILQVAHRRVRAVPRVRVPQLSREGTARGIDERRGLHG